jgi:hypothetical protein
MTVRTDLEDALEEASWQHSSAVVDYRKAEAAFRRSRSKVRFAAFTAAEARLDVTAKVCDAARVALERADRAATAALRAEAQASRPVQLRLFA